MINDQQPRIYMQRALDLARQAEGRTAPNPPVGAVIVKDGKIIGEGFHPRAGAPHAEIFALRQAAEQAVGAEIYVTLEPCSHFGKTPPCADALIAAGINKVFIGVTDPNPQVSGRGIERLKSAGIKVYSGVLEEPCSNLIAPFSKHIRTGLPFTVYKTAMTLDGNTATSNGDSKWVSSVLSRERVHQLRNRVDAIMVGIESVLYDDPLLNTRLSGIAVRDPLRIVVDSHLRMPTDSRMLKQSSSAGTLIATCCQDAAKRSALEKAGAEVVLLPAESAKVSLNALWKELGRRNVQHLLLEGGATLATSALTRQLIDRMMVFIAPKMLGGVSTHGIFSGLGCLHMAEAIKLGNIQVEQIGEDVLVMGDIVQCLPD